MRKIYLASGSRARKKILDILGLKFTVLPSRAEEKAGRRGLSYAQLVQTNALRKAQEVAGRVSGGVIIAADTIVVQDGRIFGKPRDMADARAMLKRLSRKPQWLYTGIAVVDKDRNKTRTSYEKTKVYMDALSDSQIDRYFGRVSPLDKAGSFDIQGKGAFFIRRIEGCFYNVVGLPLRRLYLMLKELDIKIFVLLFCLIAAGCSTEYNIATGKEDSLWYSTDREVRIGQVISKQVEKEYKPVDDPLIQKRTEDIGKKIAAVCDRKDVDYTFRVLNDDEVNAFSLPGGYVYVFKGLIDKVSGDDELAAVLAHEVGHIVARHSVKKLQAATGYSLLRIVFAQSPGAAAVGTAADAAFTELIMGYSREDELLADQLASRYTKLAGYNPEGMVTFLKKLQDISRRKPSRERSYYRTHPYVPDRIRIVKEEMGKEMDFKDFINIQDKAHQ
ncbi:MAG TPA: Maf family nucleotide pyrophosphatase [Patescibacteria group bacterium]|nr:Maf family nucleotide pyrophosphatase [Patescibacteria group bacterium]